MAYASETLEQWEHERHGCEVRFWLRQCADAARTGNRPSEQLEAIRTRLARHRDEREVARIVGDVRSQWKAGNRGEAGQWR